MNTYRVWIGSSISLIEDVLIVRAKSVGDAEKKVMKTRQDSYSEEARVVKIEELSDEFIE